MDCNTIFGYRLTNFLIARLWTYGIRMVEMARILGSFSIEVLP